MFEPEDVAGYRQVMASMLRRAGKDDPEALAQARAVLQDADRMLGEAARNLVASEGYSWSDLSRACGVARSGSYKLWAR